MVVNSDPDGGRYGEHGNDDGGGGGGDDAGDEAIGLSEEPGGTVPEGADRMLR